MVLVPEWLWTEESSEDRVLVTASGAVTGGRADELWSDVEGALNLAVGRSVVVDLTEVTAFDVDTIEALRTLTSAARRRRDDLALVVRLGSALARYARRCELSHVVERRRPTASEGRGQEVVLVPSA